MKTTILFFPGMIFHELMHVLACLVLGVKVHEIKLWGREQAFVKHSSASAGKVFWISFMPFIMGVIVTVLLLIYGHGMIRYNSTFLHGLFIYWLAISILIFAFPSIEDVMNVKNTWWGRFWKLYKNSGIIGKTWHLFAFPVFYFPVWLFAEIALFLGSSEIVSFIVFASLFGYSFGLV